MQPDQAPAPRPGRGRGTSLLAGRFPTLVGLVVALTATIVYFLFYVRPSAPPAPTVVARLTAIEGNVRVKPVTRGEWIQGQPAQNLMTGDVVQTDPRSGAELTFTNGNVVRVRPDSVVFISPGDAPVAE